MVTKGGLSKVGDETGLFRLKVTAEDSVFLVWDVLLVSFALDFGISMDMKGRKSITSGTRLLALLGVLLSGDTGTKFAAHFIARF